MKKSLLIFASALAVTSLSAQDAVSPAILTNSRSLKVSANGVYVVSQDQGGMPIIYNTVDKSETEYPNYYPGIGTCVSNTGILVGQTATNLQGAIMQNGKASVPTTLRNYVNSALESITPDGTRSCGYVANPNIGALDIPIYCDMTPTGGLKKLNWLPYPERDFLGDIPQFITAVCISDDGKTIIGQVMDGTGFFCYPIIYQEDETGKWNYSLPSQDNFNPDHLPLPKWPEEPDDLYYPVITDYMTPENKANWDADMQKYESSNGLFPNPWDNVLKYMDQEQYDSYQEALKIYNKELGEYNKKVDEYWEQYNKVTAGCKFAQGIMALNPQGTLAAMSQQLTADSDSGVTDVASGYVLYLYDLTDNSVKIINSKYKTLIPIQILSDGTVISYNPGNETDYVLLPGADEYITFEEYIQSTHPTWLPWMQKELKGTVYEVTDKGYESTEALVAGIICFSADGSVMAGGLTAEFYSYVFGDGAAGVEGIAAEAQDGRIVVYNLNGVKVLDTKNVEELNSLAKGLYIINGKKVIIK